MKIGLFLVFLSTSIYVIEGVIHRQIVIPKRKLFPNKSKSEWNSLKRDIHYIPEKIKPSGEFPQPESAGSVKSVALPRIIGGKAATANQFPWQVSIVMDEDYFCGGSLLTQNWILTAGHCIHDIKEFTVRAGSLEPFEGQTETTSLSILHHKYNPHSIKNDIGLIQLSRGFNLTANVNPIKLPKSWYGTPVGEVAVLSGWGKTADNSSLAPTLRYANLQIVDNNICLKTFGTFYRKQLCASGVNRYKSACSGDSGSPLIIQEEDGRFIQIGIVSYGSSFGCEKGFPLVFTRLSSYLHWISKQTQLAVN